MVALPNVTSQSGPRITVNDWLKDPLRIPTYMISLLKQGFLADAVLRTEGTAPAGVVRYDESNPIYADATVANRAEFAEVPIAQTSTGQPNVAYTVDKSLAVLVSDEDQRRSATDKLSLRMTQVMNTIIRAWDDVFVAAALGNANVNTMAASAAWSVGSTDIRKDLNSAAKLIEGALDAQGSEMGFIADTIIVNRTTKFDLLNSDKLAEVYAGGDIADENLKYTGVLPKKILAYDVLFSPRVPAGKVIVLQRKVAGFIADEVGLNATPMYRDEPRKTWRSDVQRVSAVGLDQPKALTVITGV